MTTILAVLPSLSFPKKLQQISSLKRPVSLTFQGIEPSTADTVRVPPGYTAKVLHSWGDPVGIINHSPSFKKNAANPIKDQAFQVGMHHDGMDYFPVPWHRPNSEHALLVVNHEYCDNGLLFSDGDQHWNLAKARKAQYALGVSIVELRKRSSNHWSIVRPSTYARRITALTPMQVTGPAAGHPLLKTQQDSSGCHILGTLQNCSNGQTPWGTYLTCEENWSDVFTRSKGELTKLEKRYGIQKSEKIYRWSEVDPRFDTSKVPQEPHRFGWIVEIDPYDPQNTPRKHTALGRIKHECAAVTRGATERIVVYTGDDEKFEYLYKFISKGRFKSSDRKHNLTLLEAGTLYVAQFHENGQGTWIPLEYGQGPLTPENGFQDQGEVLVKTRIAADLVGATKLDRPEWIAIDPKVKGSIYCTLTNNSDRGQPGKEGKTPVNPRENNLFGHILHWQEQQGDPEQLSFTWDIFAMGGLLHTSNPNWKTTSKQVSFGSPDGLKFDHRGVMWVQTDVSTSLINQGPYQGLGNNQMFAVIPGTNEFKRFLTGPCGCELTGIAFSPDNRTLFVNIQHPGETGHGISDPVNPLAVSSWPDGKLTGRPRSSTLVITKDDGGVIGT
ncbi:MAG: PhoX family phosphatase [Neisseriaceae bacterium]